MRNHRGGESEVYHLTCPVCGTLPGTSCLEDYQELGRIHPSRRISVAERSRRHAASGWEPPELTERRLKRRDAEPASAPPAPGPAPRARAKRRKPGVTGQEPYLGTWKSAREQIWLAAGARGEAGTGTANLGDDSVRGWFAGYLGTFPRDAVVPRWKLRNTATAIWLDIDDGPLLLSPARRLHRRTAGHGGSSKGRRSSQKLADHLRGFEELGLIRRDHARDTVIVTNPAGLLRLAAVPAAPWPGLPPEHPSPHSSPTAAGPAGLPPALRPGGEGSALLWLRACRRI
jgi:hypothetical protein